MTEDLSDFTRHFDAKHVGAALIGGEDGEPALAPMSMGRVPAAWPVRATNRFARTRAEPAAFPCNHDRERDGQYSGEDSLDGSVVRIGESGRGRALASIGVAALGLLAVGAVYLRLSFAATPPKTKPAAATSPGPVTRFFNVTFGDAKHGAAVRFTAGPYTSRTIYLTSDAGRTWQPMTRRPYPIPTAVTFIDSRRMLAEEAAGTPDLLLSEDAGRTWQVLGPDPRQAIVFGIWPAFVGTEGWWLDWQPRPRGTPPSQQAGMWHTSNSGHTWSRLAASGIPLAEQFGQVLFLDSRHGVLTGSLPDNQTFVLATTDGGESWQTTATFGTPPLGQGLLRTQLLRHRARLLLWLFEFPADPQALQAAGWPPIRVFYSVSDDAGATWGPLRVGPTATVSAPGVLTYEGDRLLLLDERRLWTSDDDGATWAARVSVMPSGLVPLSVAGAVPDALYIVAGPSAPGLPNALTETLLRSADGGIHWSEVRLPAAKQ